MRAAACKLLGALCSMPALLCGPQTNAAAAHAEHGLAALLLGRALLGALGDAVLSVRVAASWALATAAATLAAWASQPLPGGPPGPGPAPLQPLPPHVLPLLPGLCGAAGSAASGDVDKVRAVGVLALGALMQCALTLPASAEAQPAGAFDPERCAWCAGTALHGRLCRHACPLACLQVA